MAFKQYQIYRFGHWKYTGGLNKLFFMAEQTECFARGIKSVGEIFVMNLPSYRIVRNIVYNFQYSIIYTKKKILCSRWNGSKFFYAIRQHFFKKKKKEKEKERERRKERNLWKERHRRGRKYGIKNIFCKCCKTLAAIYYAI